MKTTVESSRFGTLEIDSQRVLNFPHGLVGFENCKRFTLMHEDHEPQKQDGKDQKLELREEQHIVHYLQCLDDPDLTFPVVDPAMFGFDFDLALSADDLNALQVNTGDYVAVLLVISKYGKDRYREELSTVQNISANISGPILINTRSRIGMQKVLEGVTHTVTFHALSEAAKSIGTANV